MSAVSALLRRDLRGVLRDRFLLWMAVYAPVIALAARLGVPFVPLEHLDLYLAPFLVMFGASVAMVVYGFGLIEEREQRTWLLLKVLPLSTGAHFTYLTVVTSLLSFLLGLLTAAVYGLPVARLGSFLVLTAAASLAAPLGMLVLGVAAANKIEGMAIAKLLSSASLAPALAFVVPPAWQWLLAWSPHYWAYLGLLRAYAGEARLAQLALSWPGYPLWLPPLATAALCVGGIAWLGHLQRRRWA